MPSNKNRSSFPEERAQLILAYLNENGSISVEEVASLCNISLSTARLQLNALGKSGRVVRTRGGALRCDDQNFTSHRTPYEDTRRHNLEKIAAAARNTVNDRDVIAIGGGMTCQYLAYALRDVENLTVFTNSLFVAQALMENSSAIVHLIGGVISHTHGVCVGLRAEETFASIKVMKAYGGADSVKEKVGFTTAVPDERTERALLLCANERYLLCDSTKFKNGPYLENIATFDEVTALITDNELTETDREMLIREALNCIVAS